MRKKGILSSSIALLMMFAMLNMISFVMADKTDGQWVPASSILTGPPTIIPGETWVTDGGIVQIRGQQIIHSALTTIGSTTYTVYVNAVIDATFNTETGEFNSRIDDVWYIGSQGSPNGFAGRTEAKWFGVTTLPPTTSANWLTEHMVLQGFGSFEGQTIMMSHDGPAPFGTLTGYCLIKG